MGNILLDLLRLLNDHASGRQKLSWPSPGIIIYINVMVLSPLTHLYNAKWNPSVRIIF
jgi:hypothetical protein